MGSHSKTPRLTSRSYSTRFQRRIVSGDCVMASEYAALTVGSMSRAGYRRGRSRRRVGYHGSPWARSTEPALHTVHAHVADAFRVEYARVVASVLRIVRDIDAAEEVVQEAFAQAL